MTVSAPAMAMAAVVSGMVALSATSYAGNDVQYPRSGLRLSSGLKVRPEPSRLMYKYKLRGEKSRNAYIVRSTAQVLEEESGAAQVLEEESGATQVLEEESGAAAGAGGDSVVSEVALLEEEPETPGIFGAAASKRKAGPLARGGTLSGEEALGKDPSTAIRGKKSEVSEAGVFEDPRWIKGTWDLTKFTKEGKVNWDSVIDAEVKRRKWLEDNPEASTNDEPVVFESGVIPWWAWVKRFHLPEAELLNGRAAMVGYVAAYLVDSATGVGLVDQQSSFFGKLLLFITILAILLIRKNEDVETLKTLAKESTFYDKQWQASWKEDSTKDEKPSE